MKIKTIVISTVLLFSSAFCFAQSIDYDALLKQAQDNTAFYETDFKANYTIVQDVPGEGQSVTEAILYRRDKGAKWTILITAPSKEKGKGYLQFDNNIWFYDPADNRFTFTSAKDRFQNTNANTSDFTPQRYYTDYKIDSTEEVLLGKLSCVLFTLSSKTMDADYPMIKLWVTKDDGLVRMKEDYSLSGQKLRTTAIPSYQSVNSGSRKYSIPVSMLIQDNLRGKKIGNKVQYEKTQVTITNPDFSKVKDVVYTKPYLEMMSVK